MDRNDLTPEQEVLMQKWVDSGLLKYVSESYLLGELEKIELLKANPKQTINEEENFNYCVGRPWEGEDGQLSIYTYFNQVKYGTMEDAEDFKSYVESKDEEKKEYFIYKLVKI